MNFGSNEFILGLLKCMTKSTGSNFWLIIERCGNQMFFVAWPPNFF